MRTVDLATYNYLLSRKGVVPRDLLWFEGKNRTTGAVETVGFWNDLQATTLGVVSSRTGTVVNRVYNGGGSLIAVDAIPLISDLTVRTVRIRLSKVNDQVLNAIYGYEPRLAFVEIHRALLDLDSRLLVAPPLPHFVGFINKADVKTPTPGREGEITLSVVSHTRELTKTNPAKRSDETQKLRSGDRFRRHSGVAGQWDFFWGEKTQKIEDAADAKGRGDRLLRG